MTFTHKQINTIFGEKLANLYCFKANLEKFIIPLFVPLHNVLEQEILFELVSLTIYSLNLFFYQGKLHWSHTDDKGNYIFDLLTIQSATVPQDLWTHIAATYSARVGRAKLYVDSQLIKSESGTGPLSTNWQGKVAIGAGGSLPGLVDEFYLMNKALAQNDIKDLTELCNIGPGMYLPRRVMKRSLLLFLVLSLRTE